MIEEHLEAVNQQEENDQANDKASYIYRGIGTQAGLKKA